MVNTVVNKNNDFVDEEILKIYKKKYIISINFLDNSLIYFYIFLYVDDMYV